MPLLNEYRRDEYSQNGEDGVLEEILRRLEIRDGCFVEFGAWDGIHLSNTYRLLRQGWTGVYIEGDARKFAELTENMRGHSGRLQLIHAYVEPRGERSLDNLLAPTGIRTDFEVLSIDVDSCDWQIWEGLRDYAPKIVIIEIDSSIPVGIHQTHRGKGVVRSSFTSTVELGANKGYSPVCHTGNLFFVANPLVSRLGLPVSDLLYPETLFDYGWKRLEYDPAAVSRPSIWRRIRGKMKRAMQFKR
jgi:hypothetical protein